MWTKKRKIMLNSRTFSSSTNCLCLSVSVCVCLLCCCGVGVCGTVLCVCVFWTFCMFCVLCGVCVWRWFVCVCLCGNKNRNLTWTTSEKTYMTPIFREKPSFPSPDMKCPFALRCSPLLSRQLFFPEFSPPTPQNKCEGPFAHRSWPRCWSMFVYRQHLTERTHAHVFSLSTLARQM